VTEQPTPLRGDLPPDVLEAAYLIHPEVWRSNYVPGRGPMHYASGTWHSEHLRELADRWERMAAAARVCAEFLP
jgi:hypothetical protein